MKKTSQLENQTVLIIKRPIVCHNYFSNFKPFKSKLKHHNREFRQKIEQCPKTERRNLVDPRLIWSYFGEFSKILTISKYAARVGMLLSATRHIEMIPDS